MSTKLTLRIDQTLIERATAYADAQGKSVSQLIADYFASLTPPDAAPDTAPAGRAPTPLVDSLRGVLKNRNLDQAAYRRHLLARFL